MQNNKALNIVSDVRVSVAYLSYENKIKYFSFFLIRMTIVFATVMGKWKMIRITISKFANANEGGRNKERTKPCTTMKAHNIFYFDVSCWHGCWDIWTRCTQMKCRTEQTGNCSGQCECASRFTKPKQNNDKRFQLKSTQIKKNK